MGQPEHNTMTSFYGNKSSGSSEQNNSGSDDGADYEPDKKLKTTTDAGFTGNLRSVFGNENRWGQSLGVAFRDVEIEDGVIYTHSEKDEYKLFSWSQVIGAHPAQYDEEVTCDKADQFMTKTYGTNEVQYEFVGARIAQVEDDEGNVLCAEDTKGDWEFGNTIMWFSGNTKPGAAGKILAQKLTSLGTDAVVDEEVAEARATDDLYNDDGDFMHVYDWLSDVSGDNLVRDDLEGRELRFFKESRESEQSEYSFHYPIVQDVKTDKDVRVPTTGDGDDGESSDDDEGRATEAAQSATSGDGYPTPVQDYVDTVGGMDTDENLARSLLSDMVAEPDNNLTEEMVEAAGGEDTLIQEVV